MTTDRKPRSNRLRALALAAELGVEIEFWSGRSRDPYRGPSWAMEYDVPAPDGKVWHRTETHFLTYSVTLEAGDSEAKPERFWKMLAEDMEGGLEDCPFRPTCECCD